jgi:acetyl-CoA carboxylase alpha subunit
MYQTLKDSLQNMIADLSKLSCEKLIETRIGKFSKMGSYTEL